MKKRELQAQIDALNARIAILESAAYVKPWVVGDYPPSTPWNPSPMLPYRVRYNTDTVTEPTQWTYTYVDPNVTLAA